ncbi:MAG: hypothetical protein HGGPFJEG_02009 [Ignavibacteria bacterium]|nr:hypothetical protein [Ignavibacteria bacterium]
MKVKLSFLTFLIFVIVSSAASQVDTSFHKIIKDLGNPPKNCRDAAWLLNKKILVRGFDDSLYFLEHTETGLKKLKKEIERHIDNFKTNMDSFNRHPQSQQQEFPGFPGDIRPQDLDLKKCELASLKIDSIVSKFKTEIVKNLDSMNAALKRTLVSDSSSREIIADEFLGTMFILFDKYFFLTESHLKTIDKFVFNFDLKDRIYFPFESYKLLQCQLSEVKAGLFFLNIIKECSKIGSRFYISKE